MAIPNKRPARPVLGYLNAAEVRAILEAPPADPFSGRRDRLLFQLLYNPGARVSERVALTRQDLQPAPAQTVTFHGKGRKARTVPLWPKTAPRLRQWLEQLPRAPLPPLFANRAGHRLTRFGVAQRLACAGKRAAQICPSLRQRRLSPPVFRHTPARHLLQAGVDITAIALWLGHASPVTTHQSVEADLEMKKKTRQRLREPASPARRFKPSDRLLAFLENL